MRASPLARLVIPQHADQSNYLELASMIDRAGYHGVAADLDQELIDSMMPEMEKRARDVDAAGLPAELTPNLVT